MGTKFINLNSSAMRIFFILLLQFHFGHVFSQTDTCSVQISLDTTVIPRQLVTTVTGTAPFLYAWNNGRTTDKIILNTNGKYAVTITDANGCNSLAEFNYNQCSVTIVEDTINNDVVLRGEVTGTPPFLYYWSDNSQTETILPNGTKNYSLTITDATGCDAGVDYEYIDRDSTNYLIEGRIRNQGNNRSILFEGTVFLYQKSSTIQYELVDSVSFGAEGEWSPFSFGEVGAGTYIIRAVLHPNSDGFDEFLPTYYGPTTKWKNARLVHIPYSGTRSVDMGMSSKKTTAGNGFISGTLTEKSNFQGERTNSNQADLSGYQLLLLDETDKPINGTYTDEIGAFFFQNLAFGKYEILVEKIGYTSEKILVNINSDTTTFSNLHFIVEVTEKFIIGQLLDATTSIAKIPTLPIKIFPSPSHSSIFIDSPEIITRVQLFDYLGQEIKTNLQNMEIDISTLARGTYFIKGETKNKKVFLQKFIKI